MFFIIFYLLVQLLVLHLWYYCLYLHSIDILFCFLYMYDVDNFLYGQSEAISNSKRSIQKKSMVFLERACENRINGRSEFSIDVWFY